MVKRIIKHVDGTEKIVEYDGHKYYRNWYDKNTDKLREKNQCEVCLGIYTFMNKSKHNKTKKHMDAMKIRESLAEKKV